jgi:hypothetical protein
MFFNLNPPPPTLIVSGRTGSTLSPTRMGFEGFLGVKVLGTLRSGSPTRGVSGIISGSE